MSNVYKKGLTKDEAISLAESLPVMDNGILITSATLTDLSSIHKTSCRFAATAHDSKKGNVIWVAPHIWLLPENIIGDPKCKIGMLVHVAASISVNQTEIKTKNLEKIFFVGGDEKPDPIAVVGKSFGYVGNRVYGGEVHPLIQCDRLEKKIIDHIVFEMKFYETIKRKIDDDMKDAIEGDLPPSRK